MRNFEDPFETRQRSFISAFSICMTVPFRFHHTSTRFQNIRKFKKFPELVRKIRTSAEHGKTSLIFPNCANPV